jgi:hypothetical protein
MLMVKRTKGLFLIALIVYCLMTVEPAMADAIWFQEARLNAPDAKTGDFSGWSVSIDGKYAIVGAYQCDVNGLDNAGAAYIFENKTTGWEPQAKLTASDGRANDRFGQSVAINGNLTIVGVPHHSDNGLINSGSVYLFERDGRGWTQQTELTASDARAYDYFGSAVSISGDSVIAGAHQKDVNGLVAAGSAYIFQRSGTGWGQQKLNAADASEEDWFGYSVSISGDYAVIGAKYDDVEGLENCGSAYVFRRGRTAWIQQAELTASDGAANDWFGHSVSICGDYIVIGAPGNDTDKLVNTGSAYVFKRDGTSWIQQAKFGAPDAAADDEFGNSVAINGENAVVGAYQHDVNELVRAGSAYIFNYDEAGWKLQTKISALKAGGNDKFGQSVSISDNYIIAGAPRNDDKQSNAGSAYVFRQKDRMLH